MQVQGKMIDYPNDQYLDDAIVSIFGREQAAELLQLIQDKRAEKGLLGKSKRWVGPWR
jgi:hypothetical protein